MKLTFVKTEFQTLQILQWLFSLTENGRSVMVVTQPKRVFYNNKITPP